MTNRSTKVLKTVLSALHTTRMDRLMAPWTRGLGAILMLHQVCPPTGEAFEPSRILQVTPEFLEEAILTVRAAGFETLSLDAVHERLLSGRHERPFVCFTLDDGYRDNHRYALPVFDAHNVPFAIYLPDTFADGRGDLWWLVLEEALRRSDQVEIEMDHTARRFDTLTLEDKEAAHHQIYWWLRSIDEDEARSVVQALAKTHDVDAARMARTLLMTWDEVREVDAHPLATIAAHTSGHYALAKLSDARMYEEVSRNLDRLEEELGERPTHFSYPYGCEMSAGLREFSYLARIGMKTAVTTRKGMIFADHAAHCTALPRLSLNGDFQDVRYLQALLSGVPFALLNKGRRLNVS